MRRRPMERLAVLGALLFGLTAAAAPDVLPVFDFSRGADGWASGPDSPAISLVPFGGADRPNKVVELPFGEHASATLRRALPIDLSGCRALRFDVYLPRTYGEIHAAAYFVDEDDFWYQTWRPLTPKPLTWETVEIELRPEAATLEPMGHARPWGPYVAKRVKEVGLRFFSDRRVIGSAYLDNVAFVPACDGVASQEVYSFETSGESVKRFGKFEITFELRRAYENPFDPAQVDVFARFISPGGRQVTVPGFFYQDYERRLDRKVERLIPAGPPKWKIRYAPHEAGEYAYEVVVADGETLRLPPRKFTCVAADDPGFVRVCAGDPHWLEFEDGKFFYPIGHNIPATFNVKGAALLGLTPEQHEGTVAYDRFLNGMARGMENYARIWLGSWSFGLEWSKKYHRAYNGLGRYNQENAWRFDYVLEKAEDLGIYIQLALTTFGHFRSEDFEGDWPFSPYNVKNGGRLTHPQEFWSDEPSQAMYQRMVRYVMARWGYSSHIAAWEMSNEIDLVTDFTKCKPAVTDWHKRCADTISKYDPNGHLLTTNFAVYSRDKDILALPQMSFSSTNHYCIQIIDTMRKTIYPMKAALKKPAIMTECGDNFKGSSPEFTERYMHIGLWSTCMMPFAGAGMPWWWDFLDDRHLYPMFKPLAEYMKGEDRRWRDLETKDGALFDGAVAVPELTALTLQNKTSGYFWIYETNLIRAEAAPDFECKPRKDVTLEMKGLTDGSYTVEFWDTAKGGRVQELTASAKNGSLRCPVPTFVSDIAGKVNRKGDQP